MLRKNMTKQEKHLWYDFLSSYEIRFRRQEIFGTYIADFYCAKARLIVELDGSQHFENEQIESDRIRTGYFSSLGIKVIRFSNMEVNKSFEDVCLAISN